MGIEIYGAAFSGAQDSGIHFTYGDLLSDDKGGYLRIWGFGHCDDRLDLFQKIYTSQSNAMWALDCPFSLPVSLLKKSGIDCNDGQKARNKMLHLVTRLSRVDFLAWLDKHGDAAAHRVTDIAANAGNRLEQGVALHNGLKLVHYLRMMEYAGSGKRIHIYPFEPGYTPAIFEVYPPDTWSEVGVARSTNVREFVDAFNAMDLLEVILPPQHETVETLEQADSLAACVTLATGIFMNVLHDDSQKPDFASDDEWENREIEGLIVRI